MPYANWMCSYFPKKDLHLLVIGFLRWDTDVVSSSFKLFPQNKAVLDFRGLGGNCPQGVVVMGNQGLIRPIRKLRCHSTLSGGKQRRCSTGCPYNKGVLLYYS